MHSHNNIPVMIILSSPSLAFKPKLISTLAQ